MSGWTTKKLGEVCTFRRGLTYSKGDEVEHSSKVVLRANNISLEKNQLCFDELKFIRDDFEIPDDKYLEKDCLLICTASGSKAHLGKVAYIDKEYDFAFGGFMGLIVPDVSLVFSRYFYYVLTAENYRKFIQRLTDGANINNLKFSQLAEFDIPIPPLAEQKRIVAKIDAAFEKIDKLKANAEKNLANAKELFQSALDEAMRPKKGWVEKRLPDISVNRDSKRVPITKSQRKSGAIPYYGASGIVDYVKDYIFDGEYLLVSEDGANLESRTYPIAFSITGKSWVNNHAHILEFKNGDVQAYVELYLNAISLKDFITGTAQPKLTQENLNKIPIHLPGEHAILSGVVGRLKMIKGKLETLQQNYERQIADCVEMRQAILREAFEGRMRTREKGKWHLPEDWEAQDKALDAEIAEDFYAD